jgi:endonuclease/exonuclease/phosphatase family metal-dependent hydrolase
MTENKPPRIISLLLSLTGLFALAVGCASAPAERAPAVNTPATRPAESAAALKVMTFNLRFASPTGPNAWPVRRPVMVELLKTASPDIFGTQEGLYTQLKDLASDLPQYDWIGLGRDGGSRGEFMAVFYRPDRFEPMEYDHFWLSDTPNVIGSTTWGNTNRRMVTWVRFRDRQTRRQFYFWNTHLDHQIEDARQKAARLIRQRIDALKTELPVILLGDFNTPHASPTHEILTQDGGLLNAWPAAAERRGENVSTFHNYRPPVKDGRHIDWILYRGPVTSQWIEVLTFTKDGQAPSDHFPVMAELRFK